MKIEIPVEMAKRLSEYARRRGDMQTSKKLQKEEIATNLEMSNLRFISYCAAF